MRNCWWLVDVEQCSVIEAARSSESEDAEASGWREADADGATRWWCARRTAAKWCFAAGCWPLRPARAPLVKMSRGEGRAGGGAWRLGQPCRWCWRPMQTAGELPQPWRPTVVAVPWARHHAGHTLRLRCTRWPAGGPSSDRAACASMRVAWRTRRAIVRPSLGRAPSMSMRPVWRICVRIGIDEISYKRHHKYLTRGGRPRQWPARCGLRPGRDTKTLRRFFDALGSAQRCAAITHVSPTAAVLDCRRGRPSAARPAHPLCRSLPCGGWADRGARLAERRRLE